MSLPAGQTNRAGACSFSSAVDVRKLRSNRVVGVLGEDAVEVLAHHRGAVLREVGSIRAAAIDTVEGTRHRRAMPRGSR